MSESDSDAASLPVDDIVSEGFGDPDEVGPEVNNETLDDEVSDDERHERTRWNNLEMDEKWQEIMQLLKSKEALRDNDSEDLDINVLTGYQKEALGARDTRGSTTPTMLHILAKNFDKGGFKSIPEELRLDIIRYLLQHLAKPPAEEPIGEDPVLTVAMKWENEDFLRCIAENFKTSLPPLLKAKDAGEMNCLHHAFKIYLPRITGHMQAGQKSIKDPSRIRNTLSVLESLFKDATSESIAATDNYGNTPIHYAVGYKLCQYGQTDTNYLQMVQRLIKRGDELLNKKDKRNQFNNAGRSPYQYYLHTKQEETVKKDTTRKQNAKIDEDAKGEKDVSGRERTHKATALDRTFISGNPTQGGKVKIDKGLAADSKRVDFLRGTRSSTSGWTGLIGRGASWGGRVPSPVANKNPMEPFSRAQKHIHPSQAHESVVDKAQPGPLNGSRNDKQEKQPGDQLSTWLKRHYIRTRPDMEAKELLYGKVASDKNLFFDATGWAGKSPEEVAELIRMLSEAGGFEDTLSYVALPVLIHTGTQEITHERPTSSRYGPNQGRQREGKRLEESPLGRTSLVTVLDTLSEVGVRNILQLHVDDMETPHHMDDAIEKAISGESEDSMSLGSTTKQDRKIRVDIWNWKKPDLSIDVITFAAPKVTKINLYWTGNQAVLRGWASNEGIPRLYSASSKELKTVVLHVSPGIETTKRTERLVNDFEKQIKERTRTATDEPDDGVKIEQKSWTANKTAGSALDDQLRPSTAFSRTPPEHVWIKSMDDFRRALVSIHDSLAKDCKPPGRIKVALIDDGVDSSDLRTYSNRVEVTGLCYWPRTDGAVLGRPWHQSTHGHGTIMANMIIRINPWVSLDVMRIQDEGGNTTSSGGSIRIHARSAARAIKDAIIRKADIISMSWTIRNIPLGTRSKEEDASIKELSDAIDRAKEKGILMFCSASDDIQRRGTDSLPYSQATHYIFRIGAADSAGQRDRATEDQPKINWFFPGKQVAEDFNPRSAKVLEYHDGSSVGTALAAGLASLIIYLGNVMQAYYHGKTEGLKSENAEKFANYARILRKRENMRKAFENITDDSHEDKKFLPVWHLFGEKAKRISDTDVMAEKFKILDQLVTDLCSKLDE